MVREEIEEYKKTKINGGNFTQKEMLIYVMSRVDKIDSNLLKYNTQISKNTASISMMKLIFSIISIVILVVSTVVGVLS